MTTDVDGRSLIGTNGLSIRKTLYRHKGEPARSIFRVDAHETCPAANFFIRDDAIRVIYERDGDGSHQPHRKIFEAHPGFTREYMLLIKALSAFPA